MKRLSTRSAGATTVRLVALAVLLLLVAAGAGAQQLTTVAVFDLEQVLITFYQDSAAVREFEQAQEQYREELLRAEQQLNDFRGRRADALERNDARTASRLREDIQALEEDIAAINERWFALRAELEEDLAGDEFYERLYSTVGFVAEDNGYTAVLEVTGLGSSLFWYSQEIDITEEVIQELLARFR